MLRASLLSRLGLFLLAFVPVLALDACSVATKPFRIEPGADDRIDYDIARAWPGRPTDDPRWPSDIEKRREMIAKAVEIARACNSRKPSPRIGEEFGGLGVIFLGLQPLEAERQLLPPEADDRSSLKVDDTHSDRLDARWSWWILQVVTSWEASHDCAALPHLELQPKPLLCDETGCRLTERVDVSCDGAVAIYRWKSKEVRRDCSRIFDGKCDVQDPVTGSPTGCHDRPRKPCNTAAKPRCEGNFSLFCGDEGFLHVEDCAAVDMQVLAPSETDAGLASDAGDDSDAGDAGDALASDAATSTILPPCNPVSGRCQDIAAVDPTCAAAHGNCVGGNTTSCAWGKAETVFCSALQLVPCTDESGFCRTEAEPPK
jgi:hypothetical protein